MAGLFAAASATVLDAHPDDVRSTMFRRPALRASGTCYAFDPGDGVLVKLPATRVAELIAEGTGAACDPSGRGRPMREWVCLAPATEQACVAYLLEARAFVTTRTRSSR